MLSMMLFSLIVLISLEWLVRVTLRVFLGSLLSVRPVNALRNGGPIIIVLGRLVRIVSLRLVKLKKTSELICKCLWFSSSVAHALRVLTPIRHCNTLLLRTALLTLIVTHLGWEDTYMSYAFTYNREELTEPVEIKGQDCTHADIYVEAYDDDGIWVMEKAVIDYYTADGKYISTVETSDQQHFTNLLPWMDERLQIAVSQAVSEDGLEVDPYRYYGVSRGDF